ncbi:MAG: XdhC family protein [Paracoccus sp. (in: a-proteobacteria)]
MTATDRSLQLRPRLRGAEAIPILSALNLEGGALAMLSRIDGRFYRPVGAIMAFLPGGRQIGQLSGGCIEGDLAIHAESLTAGDPAKTLRYGAGSPFVDIRLPCGSGIEVMLTPVPAGAFSDLLTTLAARRSAPLGLPGLPALDILPRTRVALFGEGAELTHFSRLAETAGFEISRPAHMATPDLDPFTAALLLFHDHHREIAILRDALASPAFWIGAQGSHTVHGRRLAELRYQGIDPAQLSRLRGPIGLIPDARDPVTLAISVLAEITAAQP